MVWTSRVEYDGCVVIVVGVNIGRLLLRVYVIVPASVATIVVIVIIVIIFFRYIVLTVLSLSGLALGTSCCNLSSNSKAMGDRRASLWTSL